MNQLQKIEAALMSAVLTDPVYEALAIVREMMKVEPVGWMYNGDGGVISAYEKEGNTCDFSPDYLAEFNEPLYTHPSQPECNTESVNEDTVRRLWKGLHSGKIPPPKE